MSLVNDMLRDLDQRRKSSDGSGASVKLMPASDMPVERKNRILLYTALGLVLVLGGLVYIWNQQGAGSEARPVNITPRLATNPEPAEQSNEAVATEQVTSSSQEPDNDVATPVVEQAIAEANTQAPRQTPQAGTDNSDTAVAQDNSAVAMAESTLTPAQPPAPTPATADNESETGAAADVAGEGSQVADDPTVATTTADPVSVTNQPPAESVKNDAEMSLQQRDTLTVQHALRLIADNDITGAYAHLERFIIDNRYAHQSRETYAKLLMNEGELLAAFNLVESGLGLAPNHPGFKKVKARILIADGQIGEAVQLLSRRAPSVQEDIEYHEILATAQLASRDFQGASMSYTSLVQQDRSQGRWWYGFAASQDSLGNHQAARQAYSRAIAQADLSPNLRRRSQERLNVLSQ